MQPTLARKSMESTSNQVRGSVTPITVPASLLAFMPVVTHLYDKNANSEWIDLYITRTLFMVYYQSLSNPLSILVKAGYYALANKISSSPELQGA
jgi:hypothetical protein